MPVDQIEGNFIIQHQYIGGGGLLLPGWFRPGEDRHAAEFPLDPLQGVFKPEIFRWTELHRLEEKFRLILQLGTAPMAGQVPGERFVVDRLSLRHEDRLSYRRIKRYLDPLPDPAGYLGPEGKSSFLQPGLADDKVHHSHLEPH